MPRNKSQLLELFDNDYLFMEKLRIANANGGKEKYSSQPDLTFSKTQMTKVEWETEPLTETLDSSAHLRYQHINNYKPLTQEQRLNGKKMSGSYFKDSLDEFYS